MCKADLVAQAREVFGPDVVDCSIAVTDEPKAASAAAGEVFDGKSKGERGCVTTRPGSAKMESREEDRKDILFPCEFVSHKLAYIYGGTQQ
jgi:hypothetical protein